MKKTLIAIAILSTSVVGLHAFAQSGGVIAGYRLSLGNRIEKLEHLVEVQDKKIHSLFETVKMMRERLSKLEAK